MPGPGLFDDLLDDAPAPPQATAPGPVPGAGGGGLFDDLIDAPSQAPVPSGPLPTLERYRETPGGEWFDTVQGGIVPASVPNNQIMSQYRDLQKTQRDAKDAADWQAYQQTIQAQAGLAPTTTEGDALDFLGAQHQQAVDDGLAAAHARADQQAKDAALKAGITGDLGTGGLSEMLVHALGGVGEAGAHLAHGFAPAGSAAELDLETLGEAAHGATDDSIAGSVGSLAGDLAPWMNPYTLPVAAASLFGNTRGAAKKAGAGELKADSLAAIDAIASLLVPKAAQKIAGGVAGEAGRQVARVAGNRIGGAVEHGVTGAVMGEGLGAATAATQSQYDPEAAKATLATLPMQALIGGGLGGATGLLHGATPAAEAPRTGGLTPEQAADFERILAGIPDGSPDRALTPATEPGHGQAMSAEEAATLRAAGVETAPGLSADERARLMAQPGADDFPMVGDSTRAVPPLSQSEPLTLDPIEMGLHPDLAKGLQDRIAAEVAKRKGVPREPESQAPPDAPALSDPSSATRVMDPLGDRPIAPTVESSRPGGAAARAELDQGGFAERRKLTAPQADAETRPFARRPDVGEDPTRPMRPVESSPIGEPAASPDHLAGPGSVGDAGRAERAHFQRQIADALDVPLERLQKQIGKDDFSEADFGAWSAKFADDVRAYQADTTAKAKQSKMRVVDDAHGSPDHLADGHRRALDELPRAIGRDELSPGFVHTLDHPERTAEALGELFDHAQQSAVERRGVIFGLVDENAAETYRRFGVEVPPGTHVGIDSYGIRHAQKGHGKGEQRRDQVPLTREDIARMHEVVQPQNVVRSEHRNRGQADREHSLEFHKRYPDGREEAVAVLRTKRGQLLVTDVWKKGPAGTETAKGVPPHQPLKADRVTPAGDAHPTTPDSADNAQPEGPVQRPADGLEGGNADDGQHTIDHLAAPSAKARHPRIQPAPLPGGGAKKLNDIIFDVGSALGRRVFTGQKTSRGSSGTYFPGTARTVVRHAGDIDVTAHELAHSLDDQLGIVADWAGQKTSPYDAELAAFSPHGSKPPSGASATQKATYARAEGVAEYIRARLVNPDAAKAAAPQFDAYLESKLTPKARSALESFSNDIRRFAGDTAMGKISANVTDVAQPPSVATKIKAALGKDGYRFETTWRDRVKATWRDDLWPVMKATTAAKEIAGITHLDPANDPETLMRLLGGINDKVEHIMEHGPVRAEFIRNGEIQRADGIGGGVEWVIGWADATTKESLHRDLNALSAYMIAQRVGERAGHVDQHTAAVKARLATFITDPAKLAKWHAKLDAAAEGRKSRIAGIGGGLFKDYQIAEKALREVAADPALKAKLDEGAKRYRAWADAVLQYSVEKGRLSQEAYDNIKDRNEQYVAMHREQNEDLNVAYGKGSKKLGSVKQVLQKFTGSTKQIRNPYENLLEQTAKTIRESDRNEALRAFTEVLSTKRGMYQGDPNDISAIGRKVSAGDEGAIKVYTHGEAEYWQFEEGVHKALKGWGELGSPNLGMLPGKVLRATIVYFPGFQIRNVIRDSFERSVISRTGATPLGALKGVTPTQAESFSLAGGGQAGHYLSERVNFQKLMKSEIEKARQDKSVILAVPGKLGRLYLGGTEASERRGRHAEYRTAEAKAKREGMDGYNAALSAAAESRDLLDFAIAGSAMRTIGRYVPFVNARVQGLRRMIHGARENPIGVTARWATYIVTPTLMNWAYHAALGGEDEKEYLSLSPEQRDLFWNFKVAPNTWLKIPKPFEFGVLASGVERAIQAIRGQAGAFDGYGWNLTKSAMPLGPGEMVGPLKPLVEELMNKDMYRQREIVPDHEVNLPLSKRKGTDHASRLGQAGQWAFGHVGLDVDARIVDHALRGYLGSIGALATSVSDLGRDNRPGMADVAKQTIGLFGRSPAAESLDVQKFMRDEHEAGRTSAMPEQRLEHLLKGYYSAKSPAERDAAAKKVREYASGQDPLMAFDRMYAEAQSVKRERDSLVKLAKENQDRDAAKQVRELLTAHPGFQQHIAAMTLAQRRISALQTRMDKPGADRSALDHSMRTLATMMTSRFGEAE